MQLKDLKANKRNPRKISKEALSRLKKSLKKFGDLGGVVVNTRTGNLVSGHQRVKALPAGAKIKDGWIEADGEKFRYREVDWPEEMEMEALLAANKNGGEWDQDLLKITVADFPTLDWEVAGFPEFTPMAPIEESDEAYAARTSGESMGEERVATVAEELNSAPAMESIFDKVEEKQNIVGKRFVIIIDCGSQELKDKIRGLITEQVEAEGGKFF